MQSAEELEMALGAPRVEAQESVRAIEQVVSSKVTPDEPADGDGEIDAAMRINELLSGFRDRP